MKTRLLNIWEDLRSSFWIIPAAMVLASIAAAVVATEADQANLGFGPRFLGFFYSGGPDGARTLLATVAGSMISIAGVTFSITIVALALASSQFGPRLLRNFMQDRGNQLALGTFISTFVYCLLVLQAVRGTTDFTFVPQISITVAVLFALASICVLIYFIHHVAVSIQADTVIDSVAAELEATIRRLFPADPAPDAESPTLDTDPQPLTAATSGYVQAVDRQGLIDLASRHDGFIEMLYRPGHFAAAQTPIARIHLSGPVDDEVLHAFRAAVIIGARRTAEQDVEFIIDQLVEIAVRALSPGINDPFTAVTCIDRLGASLTLLSRRNAPPAVCCDEADRPRLQLVPYNYAGLCEDAFNAIRQAASTSPTVILRLMETLTALAAVARDQTQLEAIESQLNAAVETAADMPAALDRQAFDARRRTFSEAAAQRQRELDRPDVEEG